MAANVSAFRLRLRGTPKFGFDISLLKDGLGEFGLSLLIDWTSNLDVKRLRGDITGVLVMISTADLEISGRSMSPKFYILVLIGFGRIREPSIFSFSS